VQAPNVYVYSPQVDRYPTAAVFHASWSPGSLLAIPEALPGTRLYRRLASASFPSCAARTASFGSDRYCQLAVDCGKLEYILGSDAFLSYGY
jgi:hypothetical protein